MRLLVVIHLVKEQDEIALRIIHEQANLPVEAGVVHSQFIELVIDIHAVSLENIL